MPRRATTKRSRAPLREASSDDETEPGPWDLRCEVCLMSENDLPPDQAEGNLVMCDMCNVWQHTECWEKDDRRRGRPQRNWDRLDFYCTHCTDKLQKRDRKSRGNERSSASQSPRIAATTDSVGKGQANERSVSPPHATRAPTPGGGEDDLFDSHQEHEEHEDEDEEEEQVKPPVRSARGKTDKLKARSAAGRTNQKQGGRRRKRDPAEKEVPFTTDDDDDFTPVPAAEDTNKDKKKPRHTSRAAAAPPSKKRRSESVEDEPQAKRKPGGDHGSKAELARKSRAVEAVGYEKIRQTQAELRAKQAAKEQEQAQVAKQLDFQKKKAAQVKRDKFLGSLGSIFSGGSKPSSPQVHPAPKTDHPTPSATGGNTPAGKGGTPANSNPSSAVGTPQRSNNPIPPGKIPIKAPAPSKTPSLLSAALVGATNASPGDHHAGVSNEQVTQMRAASRAAVRTMQAQAVNLLAAGDSLQSAERRILHEARLDPRFNVRSWQFGISQSLFVQGGPMDPSGSPLEPSAPPASRLLPSTAVPGSRTPTPRTHAGAGTGPTPPYGGGGGGPASSPYHPASRTTPVVPSLAAPIRPQTMEPIPAAAYGSSLAPPTAPISPRLQGPVSPGLPSARRMQT